MIYYVLVLFINVMLILMFYYQCDFIIFMINVVFILVLFVKVNINVVFIVILFL